MRWLLFLVIPGLLFFTSCFTAKKIPTPNPPPTTSIKKENAYSLMTKMKGNNLNYRWISARFTADIDNDSSSDSFSGVVRLRKDSIIWMSVSVILGAITAVHAKLDGDSVIFIDHIHSQYFKGTYDYLDTLLNEDIDFDLIQSVMVGNSLEFYNDTTKMNAYYDGKARDYVLSTVRKRRYRRLMKNKPLHTKNDAQLIWLDASDFHIKKIKLEDFVTHHTFEASYDDFEKKDSGSTFPMHIHYEINTGKKVIKIDLKYKKVNFVNSESIPFTIPVKYEQIHY
jgi:hypothetical protein